METDPSYPSQKSILYLNTRSLPLERDAEIKAALEMGLQPIVVAPQRMGLEKYHLEHTIEVPVGNYDEAEQAVMGYLRDHSLQVQGVIGWSDKETELVARLGQILSVPSSSTSAALNVRNKARLRKILEEIPAINPRYHTFHDEQSFFSALEYVKVPALIKPVGASGGRGIVRIHSFKEAPQKYAAFRTYVSPKRDEIFSYFPDEFLLEEELQGSEHSVAGIVIDKQVHIYAIIDKEIDAQLAIQYRNVTPTRLSLEIQEEIFHTTRSVIAATGINWCGFHLDFMMTSQGLKVLEVGGRYGGECITSHLIPLSVEGLDPYQALIQTALGVPPVLKENYLSCSSRRAGMLQLFTKQFGHIKNIVGLEEAKNHSQVKAFLQVRGVGDRTYHPLDRYNSAAIAYVIVQTEKHEDIEATLDHITQSVSIQVE